MAGLKQREMSYFREALISVQCQAPCFQPLGPVVLEPITPMRS